MKMTAAERHRRRASASECGALIESLAPNPEERQAFLEALASSIRYADGLCPDRWGVTAHFDRSQLWFNVGGLLMLFLGPAHTNIAVEVSDAAQLAVEETPFLTVSSRFDPRSQGVLVRLPIRSFREGFTLLEAFHRPMLHRASTGSPGRTRAAHSPGVLAYLRNLRGLPHLPAPSSSGPSLRSGTPPLFGSHHTQGYEPDPRVRRAIERHAMALAEQHFECLGYDWEDVSLREPFDLVLRRNGEETRVEVKGSRMGELDEIEVTRGEVESARAARTHLAVVAGIKVVGANPLECSGGRLRIIESWRPRDGDLKATRYRCSLGGSDG